MRSGLLFGKDKLEAGKLAGAFFSLQHEITAISFSFILYSLTLKLIQANISVVLSTICDKQTIKK
jgi:hypothetical protein